MIPDFGWTPGDDVSASGQEGVTHNSLYNRTLSSALAPNRNDLRKFVVIDLTRHVLKLTKTCGQNVEGLVSLSHGKAARNCQSMSDGYFALSPLYVY